MLMVTLVNPANGCPGGWIISRRKGRPGTAGLQTGLTEKRAKRVVFRPLLAFRLGRHSCVLHVRCRRCWRLERAGRLCGGLLCPGHRQKGSVSRTPLRQPPGQVGFMPALCPRQAACMAGSRCCLPRNVLRRRGDLAASPGLGVDLGFPVERVAPPASLHRFRHDRRSDARTEAQSSCPRSRTWRLPPNSPSTSAGATAPSPRPSMRPWPAWRATPTTRPGI